MDSLSRRFRSFSSINRLARKDSPADNESSSHSNAKEKERQAARLRNVRTERVQQILCRQIRKKAVAYRGWMGSIPEKICIRVRGQVALSRICYVRQPV